jgi:hypothetical protein
VRILTSTRLKLVIAAVFVAASVALFSYVALGGLNSLKTDQESKPFAVRVETDKFSYAPGQTVEIRIYLINHTNDTIELEGSATAGYAVYDSRGEIVFGQTILYNLMEVVTLVVPPQSEILFPWASGQSGTRTGFFEWNQITASVDGSETVIQPISSSGDYIVKAGVSSADRSLDPINDASEIFIYIGR